MERSEWLAERRTGVFSTDAAAVVGMAPPSWRVGTALAVYLDKKGLLPEEEATDAMRLGTFMEPFIASMYERETGVKLEPAPPCLRHPVYKWMGANLDRLHSGGASFTELKLVLTPKQDTWGEAGTDQVPEHYLIQCQHQLAVTGLKECELAALFLQWPQFQLRRYPIHRNDLLVGSLIEAERELWHRIERSDPPPLDVTHPSSLELVRHLYGVEEGRTINLDGEFDGLARDYLRLGEKISEASDRRDAIKTRLLAAMRDAALAMLPDGTKLTRKRVKRKAYSVAASEFVQFSVKPPREDA